MHRHIIALAFAALASFFFGIISRAQNVPAQSSDSIQARHSVAINLLRAINTAEVVYRGKNGRFADWDGLLATEEFGGRALQWVARHDPQLAGAHFSKGLDILPGWRLRMNIHADGQGYDLNLEDATDKACGYAALTDERRDNPSKQSHQLRDLANL